MVEESVAPDALTARGQALRVSKRSGRGCFKSKRADLVVVHGHISSRQTASKVMSTATTRLRQYRFPPVVGTVTYSLSRSPCSDVEILTPGARRTLHASISEGNQQLISLATLRARPCDCPGVARPLVTEISLSETKDQIPIG